MTIVFSDHAWEDYLYWQDNDPKILARINVLIKEIQRTPFSGIGKPQPLKYALKSYWSRRITDEHRIVYSISGDLLMLAQIRHHY